MIQLAAQVMNGRRWKTVEIFEGDLCGAERWFRQLLKKYRPSKPRMRLVNRGTRSSTPVHYER